MISVALLVSMTAQAAVFDVYTIPLEDPRAEVFLAQTNPEAVPGLFVLEGSRLTLHPDADAGDPITVELDRGTSAFDVADLDGDGHGEVVAICGDRIVTYSLEPGGIPTPRELFSLETQLADPSVGPYPHVLTTAKAGRTVLVLPTETALEVRKHDGSLDSRYPISSEEEPAGAKVHRFRAGSADPTQVAPAGGLEGRVTYVVEPRLEAPEDLFPAYQRQPYYRRGTALQAHDAAGLDAVLWPWFPLRTDGTTELRAHYAVDRRTLVRLRNPERPNTAADPFKLGPVRRYPGEIVVLAQDLPDFDGDGYVDLVLWTTPEPALSVGSMSRELLRQDRPVRVAVYLFLPEKNRFAPSPAAWFTCRVPTVRFLMQDAAGPLQNMVLRDFDGDGKTDCGLSVQENAFAVWLYDDGFLPQPDEAHTLPEPPAELVFKEDLDGNGRTSLAFRTTRAIHVFRASRSTP